MLFGNNTQLEERATYLGLTGLFLSLLTLFSIRRWQRQETGALRPFDFVLLSFATYRMGRLAAYDKVMEPIRRPFTQTTPDSSGAGKTVVPRGTGARRALGGLFSCPICTGTWIAAGLVYGLELAPGPTRLLLSIMSAIGAGELLNAATEALEWTGQAERIEVGVKSSGGHASQG